MSQIKSAKKLPFSLGFDRIIRVRFPDNLLAQILKRNRNLSKFIRSSCQNSIRFAPVISQAKKLNQSTKISSMKVVEI
jgi:hypothetical protein